ncbi:MAG: glycosyltransferase family 2 protein [Lachnospiraceae bacterium]|nr:glycosyltransferase family 2 protein [Lachnospiraceae bacterium]
MQPYISIVTPLFNQPDKIGTFIESIKAQTCDDLEVIVVDDGSTDDSLKVLMEAVKGDDRFKVVVHEKNGSVLAARKDGLSAACGKYLIFVDIDDYLDKETIGFLKGELEREPVDVLGYGITYEPKGEVHLPPHRDDYLKAILTNDTKPSLMYFAFNMDICKKAVPYIKDGYCNMAEDLYIAVILHYLAKSYRFTDRPLYHYNVGEGMSNGTANLSEEKLKRQVSHIDFSINSIIEFLQDKKPEYVGYLKDLRTDLLYGTIYQYGGLETSWSKFIHYMEILNTEENEDFTERVCMDFIPLRADYYKNHPEVKGGKA